MCKQTLFPPKNLLYLLSNISVLLASGVLSARAGPRVLRCAPKSGFHDFLTSQLKLSIVVNQSQSNNFVVDYTFSPTLYFGLEYTC
jgi:hypothetical protein